MSGDHGGGVDGPGPTQGLWLYNRNMTLVRQVTQSARHGDPGIDGTGREVWVQCSPSFAYDLINGSSRALLPSVNAYDQGHVSCRNVDQQGWAIFSHMGPLVSQPGADQVVAVKLDGSLTVRPFGFSNHRSTTYEEMPFAVPSRDGRKMLFGSEWGAPGTAYAYILEV